MVNHQINHQNMIPLVSNDQQVLQPLETLTHLNVFLKIILHFFAVCLGLKGWIICANRIFLFLQLNNYRSVRHVMKNSISGRVSYSLLCM